MITWLSIILCDLNRYLLPTWVFKHTGRKVWHNQWLKFADTFAKNVNGSLGVAYIIFQVMAKIDRFYR